MKRYIDFPNNIDELVPHQSADVIRATVVQKPLCRGGDSRSTTTLADRAERAHTGGVLVNFVRLLEGKLVLSPEDEFENPINGFISSMIVESGYHSGRRQSVLFLNGRMHSQSRRRNANLQQEDDDGNGERDVDGKTNIEANLTDDKTEEVPVVRVPDPDDLWLDDDEDAQKILCWMTTTRTWPTKDKALPLIACSKSSSAPPSVMLATWTTLMTNSPFLNHSVISSSTQASPRGPHRNASKALYIAHRKKAGNNNVRGVEDHIIESNNTILTELVESHAETKSKGAVPFHVRENDETQLLEDDDLEHTNLKVVNAFTVASLRNRLVVRPSDTETTRNKAVKFPHLGLHILSEPKNGYVAVALHRQGHKLTKQEQDELFEEFLQHNRPKGNDTAGEPFWCADKSDVTELDDADFEGDFETSFPYGFHIRNGYAHRSLGTKLKRLREKNMGYLLKKVRRYAPQHGYKL
eukprot:scaffold6270_cov162-Amphora_coffeaeformis.AAC.8